MTERALDAVVLAAGEGTRMRSTRPKPLHLICGRAMLLHILDAIAVVKAGRAVVVVGHGAERVTKKLSEQGPPELVIDFVEQPVQRGTGDAALVALTAFPTEDLDDGDILVLPGDTPLVRPETLAALVASHRDTDAAATLLTAELPDPTGYGRVVRDRDDRVKYIVEEADATAEERAVSEVATSVYCFRKGLLAPALRRLSPENVKHEYYLTDVVQVLSEAGYQIGCVPAADAVEVMGVNDRVQLAVAEAQLRNRINDRWLRAGVTMVDPSHTYVDTTVQLAEDVTLFPGTILQGRTTVGSGAEIGPDSRLVDTVVGPGAVVAHTVARDAEIGEGAVVGPFAHLPAGSQVSPGARTGPFYTSGGAT
jgi:bifunctional UDP-N-acetylglucosamine pyrophosphorylase/glucosamine-1-phosphate N-acetyltransferase